eukprot:Hpha_TRINITY_DN34774_c0_g1::TRINITY_DN34774_c0_g1_i1::g.177980::m.177980
MGGKQAKLAKAAADAGLGKEEGLELHKVYDKLTNSGKLPGVSRQQFIRLYSAQSAKVATAAYESQDVAGKDFLDFAGFTKACALIRKNSGLSLPNSGSVAAAAAVGRSGYTSAPAANKGSSAPKGGTAGRRLG